MGSPAMPARGGEIVVNFIAPGMAARELAAAIDDVERRLAVRSEVGSLDVIIRDGEARDVIRPRGSLDALDSAVQGVLAERSSSTA